MKRILLGSSALIGAALMAQPASAQLEVSFGGNVTFKMGYADGEGEDYADFATDPELRLEARGTADNGLNYSATIDIEVDPDEDVNTDEAFITLRGSWGSLILGDEDGAAAEMDVYAPTPGIGQFDGFGPGVAAQLPGAGTLDDFFFAPIDDGDDTKIVYYTPRFAGFQVGVSYAPRDDTGSSFDFGSNPDQQYQAGVNYSGTFGAASVAASAVYTTREFEGIIDESEDGWAVGLSAGFGPFTVGGNYVDRDDVEGAVEFDQEGFTVGASYTLGPWAFGANYLWNDFDDGEGSTIFVGANYTLAPGLTVAADLGYLENDRGGVDADAYVAVSRVRASF